MKRLAWITWKETLHILRDPRTLILALVVPVVLLVIFGYALTFDLRTVTLGVVDRDRSPLSRSLIRHLEDTGYFRIVALPSPQEHWLRQGKVLALLVIPQGFETQVGINPRKQIQMVVDGTDDTVARLLLAYLQQSLQAALQRQLHDADALGMGTLTPSAAASGPSPQQLWVFLSDSLQVLSVGPSLNSQLPLGSHPQTVSLEIRIWFNPSQKTQPFVVSGLVALIMMLMSALLTAITIAREWEFGTLEQLLLTPLKPWEFILGKLVPYIVLAFIDLVNVLALGTLLFDLPIVGSLLLLFLLSALFVLAGVALGIAISTTAKNQQLAMQMAWLATILPVFLLSGFIFPIENMPGWLQAASAAVPARFYLVILRSILFKGSGWAQLTSAIQGLALLALVFVGIAVVRFWREQR